MLHALFWLSLAGLFYIYLGYPALVVLRARLSPRPVRKAPFRAPVSVVISVYGEAAKLGPKLRSLLDGADADLIHEILVGSDGSPDDVASAVADAGDARIRLFAFPQRRGKPSVLNDLMALCAGEIVVFTDARQPVDPGALRALLSNCADPSVGVVSGELVFVEEEGSTAAARGIDAYWRYEKMIRDAEGRIGSVPGATGALYAIRRECLRALPAGVLLDDVAIPFMAIFQGKRCVFEAEAKVYDVIVRDAGREAVRKRRTIAGNVQLLQYWPSLLNPFRNPAWFAFVSHKIARLISPFLLFAILIANAALLASVKPFYLIAFALQISFWSAALIGWVAHRMEKSFGFVGVPFMFIALNISTLLALSDALRGRYSVKWTRSDGEVAA